MKPIATERVPRRQLLTTGAAILGASLAGCLGRGFSPGTAVTELTEESFPAPSVESITVDNAVGDVTISAVGTGDVGVQVLKHSPGGRAGLAAIDVTTALTEGVLTIETAFAADDTWRSTSTPSAAVTVTVPEGSLGPAITSATAEIGAVTLLNTRGDTSVVADLGDVTASGVDGYLSLRSNLGRILASNVTGLDAVHTELGDIKVDLFGLRNDIEIGTGLGSITVGVANDLDLDILAETNGGLDANLPATDSRIVGSRYTGRLNRGGRQLHVYGDLGDVSLRSITRPVD